jgi:hypothetical protein
LRGLVADHLASAFQVGPANPLVGIEERAVLLRRLGEAMTEQPEVFGEAGGPAGCSTCSHKQCKKATRKARRRFRFQRPTRPK